MELKDNSSEKQCNICKHGNIPALLQNNENNGNLKLTEEL